jgi:D-amino-acid dehydrogenase
MKIAVLGAGLTGITTAYFLAKAGHKVIIIDRQDGTAKECSYSNASQLSYCNAQPWSNRGAVIKGLKWLGRNDAPLRFRFLPDYNFWKWIIKFLSNCTPEKEAENTKHILNFCLYSREILHRYEPDFDFNFDYKKTGKIFVFETQESLESYRKQCQLQEKLGAPYEILDFEELLQHEPNLKHMKDVIIGAIRDPIDETADAYKFCLGLENKLKEMGAEFHYNTTITDFNTSGNKITSIITDKETIIADKYVFSLGAYSPKLSAKLGIKLPIFPIKGYSITLDVEDENCAPVSSITYQSERTVFSRIGQRVRVSGTAEFAGWNHDLTPHRIEMLKKLTKKVFPTLGNLEQASEWACLRPSTPDCRPIVCNSKFENLVLNTGHGSLGWTMCYATGKIASDLVEGKKTEIDINPYSLNRF